MWMQLGHCQLTLNSLPEALAAYQAALLYTNDRHDPQLWCGLGITYARNRDYDEAKKAFETALQHEPNAERVRELRFRLAMVCCVLVE